MDKEVRNCIVAFRMLYDLGTEAMRNIFSKMCRDAWSTLCNQNQDPEKFDQFQDWSTVVNDEIGRMNQFCTGKDKKEHKESLNKAWYDCLDDGTWIVKPNLSLRTREYGYNGACRIYASVNCDQKSF